MNVPTYVVLRGDAAVVVGIEERKLAEDVVAHTGNLTEDEESAGASSDTESSSEGATVRAQLASTSCLNGVSIVGCGGLLTR